ncbi:MAG: hypothetical protein QXT28_06220 [Thermofilaceae archaeon]
MTVWEARRCIWGPFEGNVYFLGGKWLYIDADKEYVALADTLDELWNHLVKSGAVSFNQVKSFLATGEYYAYWGDPSLRAREEEVSELARTLPERVLMLQQEPDEPVVTLDKVPLALLERFMRGELTAADVAKTLGLV